MKMFFYLLVLSIALGSCDSSSEHDRKADLHTPSETQQAKPMLNELYKAIDDGDLSAIKNIVPQFKNVLSDTHAGKEAPIYYAIKNDKPEIALWMLDKHHGEYFDHKYALGRQTGADGNNCLMLALYKMREGQAEMRDVALAIIRHPLGEDAIGTANNKNLRAIFLAIELNDKELIDEIIRVRPDERLIPGMTSITQSGYKTTLKPFEYAQQLGKNALVKRLNPTGANIAPKNNLFNYVEKSEETIKRERADARRVQLEKLEKETKQYVKENNLDAIKTSISNNTDIPEKTTIIAAALVASYEHKKLDAVKDLLSYKDVDLSNWGFKDTFYEQEFKKYDSMTPLEKQIVDAILDHNSFKLQKADLVRALAFGNSVHVMKKILARASVEDLTQIVYGFKPVVQWMMEKQQPLELIGDLCDRASPILTDKIKFALTDETDDSNMYLLDYVNQYLKQEIDFHNQYPGMDNKDKNIKYYTDLIAYLKSKNAATKIP